MTWTTLVDPATLAGHLANCLVIDCRHSLAEPQAGRQAWLAGHIPGARFLHLDEDLSSPVGPRSGRHPLPDREALRATLARLGLSDERQLVVYDDAGGAMAGRLWWLARWLGHEAVAVLDGGLPAWQAAGHPLETGVPPGTPAPGSLARRAPRGGTVDQATVRHNIDTPALLVVDARSAERYRGEVEPIDPVAGHIPGSVNRPLTLNLGPDGRFLPAAALREAFRGLLGERAPASVVHSCGSGVSACHNLLAMEHAGLHGSLLYPGSWSQWCSDPASPVATGPAP